MNSSQRAAIELDNARLRTMRIKAQAETENEARLQSLADDSGGMFQSPEEPQTMWTFAAHVARATDSQYVITYTPTSPITSSRQERKVRVSCQCDGVTIRCKAKAYSRQVDSMQACSRGTWLNFQRSMASGATSATAELTLHRDVRISPLRWYCIRAEACLRS